MLGAVGMSTVFLSPGGFYAPDVPAPPVLCKGDTFTTYIPDELEPPFDAWAEDWLDYVKRLSDKPLTLLDPLKMDSDGVKIPGWVVDSEVETPGSHIVRWLPSTWLLIGKAGGHISSSKAKVECDCPWLDVLRHGCKKHK